MPRTDAGSLEGSWWLPRPKIRMLGGGPWGGKSMGVTEVWRQLAVYLVCPPTACLVASPSSAVVKLVTLQGLCPDERIG